MLRRDNIFHPRDRKKQYSKKKGKKKGIESPGDTDGPCATAKLRNSFSIRSRPRREKEDSVLHSVDEIHRSTGPDRSFFRPLFLYILSNSSPSRPLLFLFLSPFFSKPIQSGRKKGKDRIRGYLTIEREWETKREREREAILLFYYLFYEVHRRRGRFREFIFNPCCRLLSIRYSDNFCFEKPW